MKKVVKIGLIFLAVLITGLVVWQFFIPVDYYEYDAVSADECLNGEIYDPEYEICYFDFYCETDTECSEVDKRYGQVLNALADEHEENGYGEHRHNEPKILSDVTDLVSSNSLDTNHDASSLRRSSLRDTQKKGTYTIEEIMAALLPSGNLSQIVKYKKDSDGLDGILAYVESANQAGSKWILAYDPQDAFAKKGGYKNINELLTTLIHEYGHILTLNNTQVKIVDPYVEYIECAPDETILNEGCALPHSYISLFVNNFWNEDLREQAYEASLSHKEEDFAFDLYNQNPNDFVTEYAATNEIEDVAESFAMFIMRDRTLSPVTLAEKKVNFFYDYPELIHLRTYMRGGIARVIESNR